MEHSTPYRLGRTFALVELTGSHLPGWLLVFQTRHSHVYKQAGQAEPQGSETGVFLSRPSITVF